MLFSQYKGIFSIHFVVRQWEKYTTNHISPPAPTTYMYLQMYFYYGYYSVIICVHWLYHMVYIYCLFYDL